MQLARLLADATGCQPGDSERSKHAKLAAKLNEAACGHVITLKGVAKWFERESIPGPWLLKIAALPKKPLNLSNYA